MSNGDNVVAFPAKPKPAGIPDPQAHAEKRREQISKLVQDVQDAAADPKRKFPRQEDEIRVAQAVDDLMHEAKKSLGISQYNIGKLSKQNGGEMHVERLRLDHTLSPADAEKNNPGDKKKPGKIKPYVILLDVLADQLQRSRDEVIYDAFRETAFSQTASFLIDEPATRLSWLLRKMADWVVQSSDLNSYFEVIRRIRASYDPTIDEIVFGGVGPLRQFDYRRGEMDWAYRDGDYGYEDYFAFSWPPYPALPAVPLLRVRRVAVFGSLEAERTPVAPPNSPRAQVAAICKLGSAEMADLPRLGPTDVLDAEIDISTDLYLAVGPKTRKDDLGPLFEIRSHVELSVGGRPCELTFDRTISPLAARADIEDGELVRFAGTVAAKLPDGWRRLTNFGKRGLRTWGAGGAFGSQHGVNSLFGNSADGGFSFEPLIGEDDTAEWGIFWLPVKVETVHRFTELISTLTPGGGFAELEPKPRERWRWLCNLQGSGEGPAEFQFANPGCRDFERALYTGAIEEALVVECHRMQRKLTECQERIGAALRRQDEVLISRWREKE